jgi:hypothetical protein
MKSTDVYSSHSTNWPAVVLAAALMVPLAGLSRPTDGTPVPNTWAPSLLVLLVVVVVAVLTSTSLRVTIGERGITARFGTLRLPRFRYPIESIASARPAMIRPWATPGIFWTHRDGLRLALRSGPAVRLTLRSGRRVTIGVDNSSSALWALERAGVADVDAT